MNEANRRYYSETMLTRRARVVIEVDVEWRPDDPGYSRSVLETDARIAEGVRLLNQRTVSVELPDGEPHPVGTR